VLAKAALVWHNSVELVPCTMSYQIARDGETIGTYTEDELVAAVESGKIQESDLAWTEGMEEWVTVESLIEIEIIEEEEPAAAPSVPAFPVPQQAPVVKPLGTAHSTTHYTAPPEPVRVTAERYGAPPPQMVRGNTFASIPHGHYGPAGSAIASLVLGILSLFFACLTGVPAIICGHIARGKIRRSGGAFSGYGMATTGLVIGYVVTALTLFLALITAFGIGSGILKLAEKTMQDLKAGQSQVAPMK
jgi:hypothetical protein